MTGGPSTTCSATSPTGRPTARSVTTTNARVSNARAASANRRPASPFDGPTDRRWRELHPHRPSHTRVSPDAAPRDEAGLPSERLERQVVRAPSCSPAPVDDAQSTVRWARNDDFKLHDRAQHADHIWECRRDRHAKPHDPRGHFHPSPTAPTPGEDASWPDDHRDVIPCGDGRMAVVVRDDCQIVEPARILPSSSRVAVGDGSGAVTLHYTPTGTRGFQLPIGYSTSSIDTLSSGVSAILGWPKNRCC